MVRSTFSKKKNLRPEERLFLTIVIVIAVMAACFVFSGCASTQTVQTSPPPVYELTLTGTIDNVAFQGIGVGSAAETHQMTIQSNIAVNYFTVQSCHRSLQFNNVITYPWYQWGADNKSFSWTYNEAPTIEDNGDCILRFCAFSSTVGSPPVACAVVDFKATNYTLPSQNICNGVNGQASGTAICHTMVGLIERVQFQSTVVVAPQVVDPSGKNAPYTIPGQCAGTFLDANQTLFQYVMPSTECSIIFMEQAKPHRRAKLTVIPYTTAIYPGS